MNLHNEFDNFYKLHFADFELLSPLFYRFPIGIRFEIGVGKTYDEKYVNDAAVRAAAIFTELFDKTDSVYIVVNSFEDDPNDLADNDISAVRSLLNNIQSECKFTFLSVEDGFSCARYIIRTVVNDIKTDELLKDIIWSDLDGRNSLKSHTFKGIDDTQRITIWLHPRLDGAILLIFFISSALSGRGSFQ